MYFFHISCSCVGEVRRRKVGGLSQLTVFDKLAQPALTGLGRVLHALACTRVYVFARACVHILCEGGAGLIGGQKKV